MPLGHSLSCQLTQNEEMPEAAASLALCACWSGLIRRDTVHLALEPASCSLDPVRQVLCPLGL